MRAFVFTDPALTSRAGQFVWLELNVDDERNAAHRERLGLDALPTFYVLNPADESVALRQVGALTVAETGAFLDDALRALQGEPPATPAEAALVRADRLNGEGKKAEATAAYADAVAASSPGWPPYARAVAALLFLRQSGGEWHECASLAAEALPRLAGAPLAVSVATSGLDCALSLSPEAPGRAAAIEGAEASLRRLLAHPPAGAAADDLSSAYPSLVRARKAGGDDAGARRDAQAWAALLETAAAAARTAEQRAVFDSHRLSAYLELGQPERAVPMLLQSGRDLPADYNPPARLAVAYLEMKRLDEALAASDRALPKVAGPRRLRVLHNRADILAARGDGAAERETLEQALAFAGSLPPGQRSEAQVRAMRRRLDERQGTEPAPR
jgi:tetratricopeptide (TPR) repeat protein